MTKPPRGRKPAEPLLYPDTVRPAPTMPEAKALRACGMKFTDKEFDAIRMAMVIFAASRQPKLLFNGYKSIAIALEIGEQKALKEAGGRKDTPLYRRALGPFLWASGLAFLNKNDRVALRQMLPKWDKLVEWREGLTRERRLALNNPREVLAAYKEHEDQVEKLGVDPAERKPSYRHPKATVLEQMNALIEQVELANERAEAAERQSEFFATLIIEVNRKAGLSEEEIAELRTKVRADLAGQLEPEEPEE